MGTAKVIEVLADVHGETDGHAAHKDLWFISTRCDLVSTT
jgi:hypothetical protein